MFQAKVSDEYEYSYRRCSLHEFFVAKIVGAVRVTVKSSSCFVPTVQHNKFAAAAAARWAGADQGGIHMIYDLRYPGTSGATVSGMTSGFF